VGSWLDHYTPAILTAIGAIGFSVVGTWQSLDEGPMWLVESWRGRVFLGATLFTLIGAYWSANRSRAARSLKIENERLQEALEQVGQLYYELCSDQLSELLRHTLGYGDTERISAYRRRGNAFQIMGRYSEDPEYNKVHRRVYPANEGVIKYAWRDGTVVAQLPEWNDEDPEPYLKASARWDLSEDAVRNLTMKSRHYVACSVYEPTGRHRKVIVVVESTKPHILDEDRVIDVVRGGEGAFIYDFFEKLESIEPDLIFSRERGF
jgi:hypothetical protein